ncbi:MAG: hypothetical protein U9Q92_01055 [archaeon]|nr:hypothetical protein [archaeon]
MKAARAELEVTRPCNLRCKTCLFSCNKSLKNELATKKESIIKSD